MTREYTCKVLEAIDNGLLSQEQVVDACMAYMSEADVAEMVRMNEWSLTYDDFEDE